MTSDHPPLNPGEGDGGGRFRVDVVLPGHLWSRRPSGLEEKIRLQDLFHEGFTGCLDTPRRPYRGGSDEVPEDPGSRRHIFEGPRIEVDARDLEEIRSLVDDPTPAVTDMEHGDGHGPQPTRVDC